MGQFVSTWGSRQARGVLSRRPLAVVILGLDPRIHAMTFAVGCNGAKSVIAAMP